MGSAIPWQDEVLNELQSYSDDLVMLNPRRANWDSSWAQDTTTGTPFQVQVEWETIGQKNSNIIVYYFDPHTISPITLMELGEFGSTCPDSVLVFCSPAYFRYGNVKLFCERFGIFQAVSHNDFMNELVDRIEEYIGHR